MRVCRVTVKLDEITPEQAEVADLVLTSALAEVGISATPTRSHGVQATYAGVRFVDARFHNARELAYIAAGIPHEWVDESPFQPRTSARSSTDG